MSRLPTPGGDDGTWGNVLNDFLEVEHNADGTLKLRSDGTLSGFYVKPSSGIPESDLASAVQTKLDANGTAVQSVNGKSGASITLAAGDVSAIPSSQLGAANGVATLDGSSTLTASQLPSSVVNASTASNNQVPIANGSGSYVWGLQSGTYDPMDASWLIAANHSVVGGTRTKGTMSATSPNLTASGTFVAGQVVVVQGAGVSGMPLVTTVLTGGTGSCVLAANSVGVVTNAVVDYGADQLAHINSLLSLAATAPVGYKVSTISATTLIPVYPTVSFGDLEPLVSGTVVVPQGVPIRFNDGGCFRACAAIAGAVLATSISALHEYEVWENVHIDANNLAQNELYLPYFAEMTLPRYAGGNATKIGLIAGDSGAAGPSYALKMTDLLLHRDKGQAVPSGSVGIYTENCTDSYFDGNVEGYDVSVNNQSGNNYFDIHAWNYGSVGGPSICFNDGATVTRYGPKSVADTPAPRTDSGASAGSGTSTITDSAITAFDSGRPVTGPNIPSPCYVGTVTPGTSFTIVTAPGGATPAVTTGSVSSVTLLGVGWMLGGADTNILASLAEMSTATGVDQGAVGVVITASALSGGIDIDIRGGSGSVRYANDVLGNVGSLQSLKLRTSNVVTAILPYQIIQQPNHAAVSIRNAPSGSADAIEHVTSNQILLSKLSGAGIWTAPAFRSSGLSGSSASVGGGYCGTTTAGSPTGATYVAGDFVDSQDGYIYICTVGGTPGTWVQAAGPTDAKKYNDLLGFSYDPSAASTLTTVLPATATLYLNRIPLPAAMSVTNVLCYLGTLGATSASNSFVALFTSAGTIVGQSADQSSAWITGGSTGLKTIALAGGPFTITPLAANDFAWAALYVGTAGGTLPAFARNGGTTALISAGTSAARSRFGQIAQASTATLASITPASVSQSTTESWWMGLS